jgi:uncharacterized OB-fold protein
MRPENGRWCAVKVFLKHWAYAVRKTPDECCPEAGAKTAKNPNGRVYSFTAVFVLPGRGTVSSPELSAWIEQTIDNIQQTVFASGCDERLRIEIPVKLAELLTKK